MYKKRELIGLTLRKSSIVTLISAKQLLIPLLIMFTTACNIIPVGSIKTDPPNTRADPSDLFDPLEGSVQDSLTLALAVPACNVSPCPRNYFVSGDSGIDYKTASPTSGDYDHPYKTPSAVALLVNPGDTVYLRASTTPYIGFSILRSGSAGHPITFAAYPGEKPELKLDNRLNIFAVISIGTRLTPSVSYVTINGLTLTGNNAVSPTGGYVDSALKAAIEDRNAQGFGNGPLNANGIVNTDSRDTEGNDNYSHHIIIKNNTIRRFGCAGIALTGDYLEIKNNLIYQNGWYSRYGCSGVSIFTTRNFDETNFNNTYIYRNRVIRNRMWNNASYVPYIKDNKLTDGNGFILDVDQTPTYSDGKLILPSGGYAGRVLIANNLAVNNGGSGIHAYRARNADIINNTAYKNGAYLENYADIDAIYSSDVKLRNNIIYARAGRKLINHVRQNENVDYNDNVYFDGTPNPTIQDTLKGNRDLVADPLFVNPGLDPSTIGVSFELQRASPAIDTGVKIPFVTPYYDINFIPRIQGSGVDRGAFELKP